MLGVVVALLLTMAGRQWPGRGASGPSSLTRLIATLPEGVTVTRGPGYFTSSIAISPDGRTLVIAGTSADGERLYQRPLDRLLAVPLAGTEGGSSPFFSPDGARIGFFADGVMRRVPTGGGARADITPVAGVLWGASWGADDRIVFSSGLRTPVYAVDAGGGDVVEVTRLAAGETGHGHPELLPDGRTLLFDADGWVHAIDLASGRRVALAEGASPRFAVTGHLVFGRGAVLLAAPFAPTRLELTGPAVPLVEAVASDATGLVHYAISHDGGLAYLPAPTAHDLLRVEEGGEERLVTDERLAFENPQFSPDGRRLAVAMSRHPGAPSDIWIHDLRAGAVSRLTFDGGRAPVWRPDGAAVSFSKLGERQGIYTKSLDGRGDAEQLLAIDEFHSLIGWTPDSRTLAFGVMGRTESGGTVSSIMSLTAGASRRVVGPASVWGGRLSPDGRWLVYYTLVSGRFEVYVTSFPGGQGRWLISEQGGRDPAWSPDGTEIYYRSGDRLVSTTIDTAAGVRVLGRRVVLAPFSPPLYDDYDIHPDGRTLAFVRPRNQPGRDIVVVLDWLTEVIRATGAGQ